MYLLGRFSILVLFIISAVNWSNGFDVSNVIKEYTAAATKNFRNVVNIYNLEPMYKNMTDGQISDLKYKLHDIYLHHLKECIVTLLLLNINEHTFVEVWDCPRFTINFNEEWSGKFGTVDPIDHKGYIEIKTGKFEITLNASYTSTVRNNETYNIISNPIIKAETDEHISMEHNTLSQGDQTQADEVKVNFNGKDQKLAKEFTERLMEVLLMKYFDSLKDYLTANPITITLNNN